jgi:hypothetical protein
MAGQRFVSVLACVLLGLASSTTAATVRRQVDALSADASMVNPLANCAAPPSQCIQCVASAPIPGNETYIKVCIVLAVITTVRAPECGGLLRPKRSILKLYIPERKLAEPEWAASGHHTHLGKVLITHVAVHCRSPSTFRHARPTAVQSRGSAAAMVRATPLACASDLSNPRTARALNFLQTSRTPRNARMSPRYVFNFQFTAASYACSISV